MSYDLMIFDPAGLTEFPSEPEQIVSWISEFVKAQEMRDDPSPPTQPIQELIQMLEAKYGNIHSEKSCWAMWPPAVIGAGRYCTLNLQRGTDTTNMTIGLHQPVRKAGLVLIDPQGRNPLMSAPGGGGLLD